MGGRMGRARPHAHRHDWGDGVCNMHATPASYPTIATLSPCVNTINPCGGGQCVAVRQSRLCHVRLPARLHSSQQRRRHADMRPSQPLQLLPVQPVWVWVVCEWRQWRVHVCVLQRLPARQASC
ncbi:hypothetical protein CLOM_g9906 [Closterium sp. NIES-68]|nr:hypothetical protein CLOM_g9906 [Closterium sp. NIES-68]